MEPAQISGIPGKCFYYLVFLEPRNIYVSTTSLLCYPRMCTGRRGGLQRATIDPSNHPSNRTRMSSPTCCWGCLVTNHMSRNNIQTKLGEGGGRRRSRSDAAEWKQHCWCSAHGRHVTSFTAVKNTPIREPRYVSVGMVTDRRSCTNDEGKESKVTSDWMGCWGISNTILRAEASAQVRAHKYWE